MKNRTTVERKSERELVVTRTFNAPARIVFEAWTKPELFKRWWVPKSMRHVPALLRDGCSCRGQVPSRVRHRRHEADGVLRQVPRSDTALAPRLDERGERRGRGRHHGDLRGKRRQDAAGPARALSLEGSSRRCPRLRGARTGWARRSSNWTSFSSPWARAWDGHEVVALAASAHKECGSTDPARWQTHRTISGATALSVAAGLFSSTSSRSVPGWSGVIVTSYVSPGDN